MAASSSAGREKTMIHDLYLRAHVVLPSDASKQGKPPKSLRSQNLWPDYALVLDTETTLDLEQSLTFGVWRFCQLQGTEYVAIQEGIFYRDGLARKDIQIIRAYVQKHFADGLAKGAERELTVLPRAEFVERVFWESVRAGALIVGFNLPFDISRIAVRWTAARNGGFSFVLSNLSKKQVRNIHRPLVRISPLNGVAEQFELTAVRRKDEQDRWRRGRLHTLAFALTDNSDLFKPAFWKRLNFYARILPDGDILPVRSVYGDKSGTCNIGVNELHWKQPMWVAGPDLITSVLLSGHIPNVQKAIRIVAHGKQRGLKPIKLRGAISVDPRKEDFFTRVIEYRKQNKNDDRLQYFLKILANSTSYGTYLELNPVKIDPRNRPKITVYSGEHIFEQLAPDTIEQPGSFYFPVLGGLITSGGRLLLGMIEHCVRDAGGTYLCCDTDALTIVASKAGGDVQMPDGAPPIKALSWKEVEQITRRFDSLSPYNRKIVPHLLRRTDDNYDKNGAHRQLFGLSIAAKRYALYTTKCGQAYCGHRKCVTIVDPKAHGLIFVAPSEGRENGLPKWWWELWRFLLTLEFKQIIDPDFNVLMVAGRAINADTGKDVDGQPPWITLPAMMKMRISTPHYLDQMKGKASPFGFVLHPRTGDRLKLTLLTPFSKNRAGWAHSLCINTRDAKSYRLNELSRGDIITLGDILCGYIQHPEIKSLGPEGEKCKVHTRGLLRRIAIKGGLQHCIGKEISRFEQGKGDFIENIDDVCIRYDGGRVVANESLIAEISARGLRRTTKETGLDRKTIRVILKRNKVKASTLAKVVIGLREK
jgi:hypothetical protein